MSNTKVLRKHVVAGTAEGDKICQLGSRRLLKSRKARELKAFEAAEQTKFVTWARSCGCGGLTNCQRCVQKDTLGLVFWHTNNNGKSKRDGARLKAMGVMAGVADIIIVNRLPMLPSARGLALEFKSSTGVQSAPQAAWQALVEQEGWVYRIVTSADAAVEVLKEYGLGWPRSQST